MSAPFFWRITRLMKRSCRQTARIRRLKVKQPRSGRSAAPACCQAQMRAQSSSGKKPAQSTHESGDKALMRRLGGFFARRRLSPHLSLAACRCSLRPDRGSLTFSLRLRAVWRHDIFRRRVIRQKNGADTFYTLHTSRSSGALLLTNEEQLRVASRRREVVKWRQKPLRG